MFGIYGLDAMPYSFRFLCVLQMLLVFILNFGHDIPYNLLEKKNLFENGSDISHMTDTNNYKLIPSVA